MKVFCYLNLHKGLWSIRSLEGETKGLVVAHRETVMLTNVNPKISEAGRQRLLRDRRKNVHAGLVGEWDDTVIEHKGLRAITYNPYKFNSFVYESTKEEYTGSEIATLDSKNKVVLVG